MKDTGLSNKEAHRCKNFWTLGLMFWIYSRPLEPTLKLSQLMFAYEEFFYQRGQPPFDTVR